MCQKPITRDCLTVNVTTIKSHLQPHQPASGTSHTADTRSSNTHPRSRHNNSVSMKPHSRALLLLLLLSATLVLFILTPVAHARPSPELKDSIMRDSRDDRNIDSRSKTKAPTPPAAQPSANSSSKTASKTTIPVIVDHDGNVEDLISVVLLLVNEAVDVQLISYVEGGECQGVLVSRVSSTQEHEVLTVVRSRNLHLTA